MTHLEVQLTMAGTPQDLLSSILVTEIGRLPDVPSPLLVTIEGPSGGYFAVSWVGDTASVHRLDTQVLIEAVKQAHAAGYPVQHELNTSLGGHVSPIHDWIVSAARRAAASRDVAEAMVEQADDAPPHAPTP